MTYNQRVLDGAKFLDDNAGKWSWLTTDWRQKIDIGTLDMFSTTDCILGQLEGDFDTAVDMIGDDLGLDEWFEVSSCFSNYTEDWKDYLSDFLRPAVGSFWVGGVGGGDRKVCSVFSDDGVDKITYKGGLGFFTINLSQFLIDFNPKPIIRFNKGDLLKAASGTFYAGNTFLYLSDDRVIMFNGDKIPQYCNLAWYEKETGKLTRISENLHIMNDADFLKDISGGLLDLTK